MELTKGPLIYIAIVLAALLMALSSMLLLFRNVFTDNPELMMIISSVLAIAVVIVLVLMLVKLKKNQ